MSQLNKLRDSQNREMILLAELAGLLHNIGKLDVNFLAEATQGNVAEEIEKHLLDIDKYQFKRFAKPNVDLIANARSPIIDRFTQWNTERDFSAFEQELRSNSYWRLHEDEEFIQATIKAAWKLVHFLQSNGPLYQLQREELQPLKDEYDRREQVQEEFDPNTIPPYERQNKIDELKRLTQEALTKFEKGKKAAHNKEESQQDNLETNFRKFILSIAGESWSLADLLTLFWDDFFYKPQNDVEPDYKRKSALEPWLKPEINTTLPMLLALAHGEMSGSEKYQITEDETGKLQVQGVEQAQTTFEGLRISTAFGYEHSLEVWQLQEKRQSLIGAIPDKRENVTAKRGDLLKIIQEKLEHGLGDTQRPINEITLWDYASSIAALFKTSIAKSFLEGQVADANQMHWRLLSVRFDGLDYILQASRIADILGRQQKYQQTLNQICIALTQNIPVASMVYQDENGLFFIVPDSNHLELEDLQNLVKEQLEKSQFDDLRPSIAWSKDRLRGKQLNLGQEFKWQDDIERPPIDPQKVKKWWENRSAQICEVCGLRPAISRETTYCTECKNNRQSRMQTWLNTLKTTIWLDEVADSNGRLALITSRFSLDHWLDGTLVESLALGIDKSTGQPASKFASFPRIQRVWQTTQTFWKQTQCATNQARTDARRRLKIQLANQPGITSNQTYELDLLGRTRMSVLWNGECLISTDNLSYTAVQLGITPEERRTPVDAALAVGVWLDNQKESAGGQKRIFQLISDDEKNRQFDIQIADIDYQDTKYATTIPILAEPRTFMALVPADKALDVAQAIQEKYEREMGKVRNRLPLHLGVVYFQRRTPLRAALDAGRRMLDRPQGSRGAGEQGGKWRVPAKPQQRSGPPPDAGYLTKGTQQFAQYYAVTLERLVDKRSLTWHVPAVMGDGQTPDHWYPYVFVKTLSAAKPADQRSRRFEAPCPWNLDGENKPKSTLLIHAGDLEANDEIYFTPATFDFEWLDTTGRRFEIAYDEAGQRRGRRNRPYLLDELKTLQDAWQIIGGKDGLTNNQIYALRDLIESKRAEWRPASGGSTSDETFKQLCREAILNAEWPKGGREKLLQACPNSLQTQGLPDHSTTRLIDHLTNWAVSGLLTDAIELYMNIMKEKPARTQTETEATQ